MEAPPPKTYLVILLGALLIIGGAVAGVITAGLETYYFARRQYQSVATVDIREWKAATPSGEVEKDIEAKFLQKHGEAIRDRELLYRVMESRDMEKRHPGQNKEVLYAQLRDKTGVHTVPNAHFLQISVIDGNPVEAAELANAIALEYQRKYATTPEVPFVILEKAVAVGRPYYPQLWSRLTWFRLAVGGIVGGIAGAVALPLLLSSFRNRGKTKRWP